MLPSQGVDAALAGVLGLLVGSFLNVVIYRMPIMMYRQWLGEAVGNLMKVDGVPSLWSLVFGPKTNTPPQLEAAAGEAAKAVDALPPFSLARPASRCGHCGHAIRWYENVPVLSYLFLRGTLQRLQGIDQPALPAGGTGHRGAVRAVRLALRAVADRGAVGRLRGAPGLPVPDRLGHAVPARRRSTMPCSGWASSARRRA